MRREAVVAGQFYPGNTSQLRAMIESFVDKRAPKEEVVGIVVPHAGYIYSGAVVGAVLSRIVFKDTFVIIGPNHTGRGKPFSIMTSGTWTTPLGEVKIDEELAQKILSDSHYLEEDTGAHESEHAIEVQVPFLQYFKPDVKIVPIMFGPGEGEVYKQIGHEIARAINETGRDAIIMASSDMNHYESQGTAQRKDRMAIDAMLAMNEDELYRRVHQNDISMCGYAPAMAMLAAAKELGAGSAELVKYQTSGDVSGDYNAVVGYSGIIVRRTSPLVKLARNAIETYVKERKVYQPREFSPEMNDKAGVFVCIKKEGELRGCIGTFEPTQDNVGKEIVANAISTASRDPRFLPVEADELRDLEYTVDVLTSPEPVASKDELDPKKYGVIVESGYKRGLLLPDLEGVDTVDQQIDISRRKAGIGSHEPVKLYRFEVKRYK